MPSVSDRFLRGQTTLDEHFAKRRRIDVQEVERARVQKRAWKLHKGFAECTDIVRVLHGRELRGAVSRGFMRQVQRALCDSVVTPDVVGGSSSIGPGVLCASQDGELLLHAAPSGALTVTPFNESVVGVAGQDSTTEFRLEKHVEDVKWQPHTDARCGVAHAHLRSLWIMDLEYADSDSPAPECTMETPGCVHRLSFSDTGQVVHGGCAGGMVLSWDTRSGRPVETVGGAGPQGAGAGRQLPVLGECASAYKPVVAAAADTGRALSSAVSCLRTVPNSAMLLVGRTGGVVQLYDLRRAQTAVHTANLRVARLCSARGTKSLHAYLPAAQGNGLGVHDITTSPHSNVSALCLLQCGSVVEVDVRENLVPRLVSPAASCPQSGGTRFSRFSYSQQFGAVAAPWCLDPESDLVPALIDWPCQRFVGWEAGTHERDRKFVCLQDGDNRPRVQVLPHAASVQGSTCCAVEANPSMAAVAAAGRTLLRLYSSDNIVRDCLQRRPTVTGCRE